LKAQESRILTVIESEDLTHVRYEEGSTTYLEVLEQQRQSFNAQLKELAPRLTKAITGLVGSILKPMFLGKGVDVPMLVILLGAIGGMMLGGPVGLFVGSVVLALAYKIFVAMLEE